MSAGVYREAGPWGPTAGEKQIIDFKFHPRDSWRSAFCVRTTATVVPSHTDDSEKSLVFILSSPHSTSPARPVHHREPPRSTFSVCVRACVCVELRGIIEKAHDQDWTGSPGRNYRRIALVSVGRGLPREASFSLGLGAGWRGGRVETGDGGTWESFVGGGGVPTAAEVGAG